MFINAFSLFLNKKVISVINLPSVITCSEYYTGFGECSGGLHVFGSNLHPIHWVTKHGGWNRIQLQYAVYVWQQHFALVEEFADSYVIVTTSRPIDREQTARHRMTLLCTDSGQPSLSSDVNVVVNVVDVDDHAPRFNKSVYNCSIRENSHPLEVTSLWSYETQSNNSNDSNSGAISHFRFRFLQILSESDKLYRRYDKTVWLAIYWDTLLEFSQNMTSTL